MKCLTVRQASEEFFKGTISQGFLYKEVRKGNIPHVRMSRGKILFDEDYLEKWWNEKLCGSLTVPKNKLN